MFDVFDAFLFDGDGVLYKESSPLSGAIEFLNFLKDSDKSIFILTNNSTKTRKEFQEKLNHLGFSLPIDNILTSAYLTSHYVAKNHPNGKVYVIGEKGLKEELKSAGLQVINDWEETTEEDIFDFKLNEVEVVVTGMDRKLNYTKIARATHILTNYPKVKFIATNGDFTFPTVKGLVPGGGAMIAILETITGRKIEKMVGKPEPLMYQLALEFSNTDKEKAIMFGDRIETDIYGANKFGIKTCLVLTGVTNLSDLDDEEGEEFSPDIIMNDLQDALNSYS